MPDLLISALVQAPFVLVMAYLVNQFLAHLDARDEEWRAFMNEADDRLVERLNALTASIERLTDTVIAHDAAVRGALQRRDGKPAAVRPYRR